MIPTSAHYTPLITTQVYDEKMKSLWLDSTYLYTSHTSADWNKNFVNKQFGQPSESKLQLSHVTNKQV